MDKSLIKYGLIGKNISYSLSPLIYNYWFKKYNIKAEYNLIDVEELNDNLINNLKNQNYKGLNITQPYKKEVLKYLDNLSQEVKLINSCNLLILEDYKIKGYNSDYIGLLESFTYYKFDLKAKNILILGAGGAVNSLIYSLYLLNVKEIILLNRDEKKIADLINIFPQIKINDFKNHKKFDIIFNSTSINFKESVDFFNIDNQINNDTLLYDLSYTSKELINNKNYINGLFMLLFQAKYNFKIWFNIDPQIDDELITIIKDK